MNRFLKIFLILIGVVMFFGVGREGVEASCWTRTWYIWGCLGGCWKDTYRETCCTVGGGVVSCLPVTRSRGGCSDSESCHYCGTRCPPPPCSPGACGGCTPATPLGYTPVNNLCPVTTTGTCTGTNGCSSCTVSQTFYLIPGECSGCTIATPEGYTDVDNGSSDTITSTCTGTNGCTSCEISKTFYRISEDPEIDIDGDPREVILPDVGDSDSTSLRGCYTEEYTGRFVNNPLNITIPVTDPDGNEEIEGVIVWFNKSGVIPETSEIVGTYEYTTSEQVAIMILQDADSWSEDRLIYALNRDGNWALVADGTLRDSSGQAIAIVQDNTVTEGVNFAFNIQLELVSGMDGIYEFNAMALDEYMLESENIDQSNMLSYFDWGVDLVDPSIENLDKTIEGPQELYLNWETLGTGSNITDIVINAYRNGYIVVDDIELVTPLGYSNILIDGELGVPSEDDIGHLNDTNAWVYAGINTTPYVDFENTLVNIRDNEGGTITMYVTAFDQGCNETLGAHSINLNGWIASKGGLMYSSGSFGSGSRDVSSVVGLDGVLRHLVKEEIDTGTELLTSKRDFINSLIHPELGSIGAVRTLNTYDTNDRKAFWYQYFTQKLNERIVDLTEFTIDPAHTTVSDACAGENCVMISEEDITIPSGYTCDKNTLFVTDGDIIINPDIESGSTGIQGCIFLAQNNVVIEEGDYKSTGDVIEYDYIEGFFMAENQIRIPAGDAIHALKDGLEVYGGMVAFGRDLSDASAILLQRNLRLFNSSNPALVLTWSPKYAKLSEIFFGTEAPMYKQEVGFKAF